MASVFCVLSATREFRTPCHENRIRNKFRHIAVSDTVFSAVSKQSMVPHLVRDKLRWQSLFFDTVAFDGEVSLHTVSEAIYAGERSGFGLALKVCSVSVFDMTPSPNVYSDTIKIFCHNARKSVAFRSPFSDSGRARGPKQIHRRSRKTVRKSVRADTVSA